MRSLLPYTRKCMRKTHCASGLSLHIRIIQITLNVLEPQTACHWRIYDFLEGVTLGTRASIVGGPGLRENEI